VKRVEECCEISSDIPGNILGGTIEGFSNDVSADVPKKRKE